MPLKLNRLMIKAPQSIVQPYNNINGVNFESEIAFNATDLSYTIFKYTTLDMEYQVYNASDLSTNIVGDFKKPITNKGIYNNNTNNPLNDGVIIY